jgi:hypothetical protein
VSLHNLLTHLRGHLLARVHRRLADLALPLLAALLVGIGSHLPAQAQGADPAADWRSAETPHFRVHYRGEQRPQAERVALAAERAFVRLQRALDWTPAGRVELAVYSEFDGANGWSTPLPYNLVGAFLAPPEGELLDNSPWLDLLLTHELVHSLHLDKVAGAPGFLRGVLGRTLWSFPNLFQPSWALEGLAVYHEGGQDGGVDAAAALGRGRLYGPDFEAWLRAEQARGFIRLSELNADGRALPLSKAYLYGGYFFDFLARRYGREAVGRFVSNYSDNLLPRFHSNPRAATGKAMDVLWEEFLRDLNRQVDERNRTRRSQAEVTGQPLGAPAVLALPSVVGLGNGHTLAVVNDGVERSRLVEFDTQGREKTVGPLLPSARLDSAANGELLITQADLCRRHYLAFDLYRWDHQAGEARRLTECAHLLRAVWAGQRVLALQLDAGRTRLVSLNLSPPGGLPQLLYAPPEGVDLVDLVALPGGLRVAFVQRQGGDWRLQELALDAAGAQPVTRLRVDAPLHSLRLGRDEPGSGTPSLEFIAARDGGSEVWRLSGERLQRLTHSHTGTVTHSGSQSAAGLATVQIAPGGHRLSRLTDPTALETLPLGPDRRWQVSGRGWATPPSASSASSPSSVSLILQVNPTARPNPGAGSHQPAGSRPALQRPGQPAPTQLVAPAERRPGPQRLRRQHLRQRRPALAPVRPGAAVGAEPAGAVRHGGGPVAGPACHRPEPPAAHPGLERQPQRRHPAAVRTPHPAAVAVDAATAKAAAAARLAGRWAGAGPRRPAGNRGLQRHTGAPHAAQRPPGRPAAGCGPAQQQLVERRPQRTLAWHPAV